MVGPPGQWGGGTWPLPWVLEPVLLNTWVPGPLHPVSPQAPNSLLNPSRHEALSPCPELCSEMPASIQTRGFLSVFF